jgi:hypothetical protein
LAYPESVYINEFGQVSCDGFCPPETDKMKDKNGRIYEDSLKSYYNLIDTTHLFHSIKSEAWAYEWGETDFITAERTNKDTVICFTQNNAATHSSLNLIITKSTVNPTIVLNSIFNNDIKTYNCKNGEMLIDKNLWKKGILKATFNFEFFNLESSDKMYWKGSIYTDITNNE